MENEIKSVARKPSGKCQWDGLFTRQAAETARNFHRTIPGYAPTPLVDLKGLAKHLGLEAFYVKDESFRFGLNAFKGLGGSFCVAQVLGEKLGIPITEMTFALLQDPAVHGHHYGRIGLRGTLYLGLGGTGSSCRAFCFCP